MTVRLTAARIRHHVAQAYGVDAGLLVGHSSKYALARPRQVAIWLCVDLLLDQSLAQIGRGFHRHHSSVADAAHTVERLRAADPDFAALTDRLRAALAPDEEAAA